MLPLRPFPPLFGVFHFARLWCKQRVWPARLRAGRRLRTLLPGAALCLMVCLVAWGGEVLETRLLHRAWVDALVLSIVLGTLLRTLWTPPAAAAAGIQTCGKTVLEWAVVLLGASLHVQALVAAGLPLLLAIATVVVVSIAVGYGIGRRLGLHWRVALLIACGNSICGNSAIAAVAPVIGAQAEEVAASIAFTAVLGVVVVLLLPLSILAFGLSLTQYGVLCGLSVYAVPQVLAATAPVALVSAQMGALVKLTRVLMLGPIVTVLSLVMRARTRCPLRPESLSISSCESSLISPLSPIQDDSEAQPREGDLLRPKGLVPWFIVGFLLMATLGSLRLIPAAMLPTLQATTNALTLLSMAALGLSVDCRCVLRAGPRVAATAALSLVLLLALSLLALHVAHVH